MFDYIAQKEKKILEITPETKVGCASTSETAYTVIAGVKLTQTSVVKALISLLAVYRWEGSTRTTSGQLVQASRAGVSDNIEERRGELALCV